VTGTCRNPAPSTSAERTVKREWTGLDFMDGSKPQERAVVDEKAFSAGGGLGVAAPTSRW
jgi:hypothetical protein